MKNNILVLVLCLLFVRGYAQDELEINYDSIKVSIENPRSERYYPKLLRRYNDFDSTLTLKDFAFIYYGFSFQENYLKKPKEDILNDLKGKEDYEALIVECKKILANNPVSLEANNTMGFAHFRLNRPENEWKKFQNRYRNFRKVIAYSGDGWSIDTAF